MGVTDRWNGARTGDGKRYEVRWRSGGVQRKRRFDVKKLAEEFDARQKVDPETKHAREGRLLTVAQMMATWEATKQGKRPKTVEACHLDGREVTTAFGSRLAASVRPSEVRKWVARDRGASIRRRSLAAFRQGYRLAIADGLLTADPTADIPLPRLDESDRRGLSWGQLEQLASAAGKHAPMVWLLGTTGLRLGECLALQVADVGPSRLRVLKSKTGKARDVPVLPFVREMLTLDEPGPVFRGERSGSRLDERWWRREVFERAAEQVGLGAFTVTEDGESYQGLTPHSLRHTAASLAIASGADVKAVQRMLGHQSATLTVDLYGHLWDEGLDTVAERMQQAREAARV